MRGPKRLRTSFAAAAALAALSASCGGDSGTGPLQLQLRVFATPASISATGSSTIIAQVTTSLAQPAPGVVIEWSNTFGFLMVGGSSGGGGPTDASGRTTATLRGEGTPGVAVVGAAVVGGGVRGQVEVRIGLD